MIRALFLLLLLPGICAAQLSGTSSQTTRLRITDDLTIGDKIIFDATADLNLEVNSENLFSYNSGADTAVSKWYVGLSSVPGWNVPADTKYLFNGIIDAIFVGSPKLRMTRVNGSIASPTATTSGQSIGSLSGEGFRDATTLGSLLFINVKANENWSSTAIGTSVDIAAIPPTTTTAVAAVSYTGLVANTSLPIVSIGTKFTASGCSNGTTVGGSFAGRFVSGTTGACTVTITFPTAANGWRCNAGNLTAPTAQVDQTASTTTTCTISGTTTTGDVINFSAMGY